MNGLHLNKHCTGDPALNFVKIIRSILDSGSAKQKPKEAHSKISSFWSSGNIPRSDKSEAIYALSHNLNKETMKWKKAIEFSPSKNLISLWNYTAKDITNVESKNENESEFQDESQKCENFIDSLFNIKNTIRIKLLWLISIWILLEVNLICFTNSVTKYTDILTISEIKLEKHFPMLYIIWRTFKIHIG